MILQFFGLLGHYRPSAMGNYTMETEISSPRTTDREFDLISYGKCFPNLHLNQWYFILPNSP